MPEFNLPTFLLGCLGGILPDVLRIIRSKYKARIPEYLRQTNFWLGVALLVGIGGITAWILGAVTAKDALIYGYASPQILSQLASSLQSERVERGADQAKGESFNILGWWGN